MQNLATVNQWNNTPYVVTPYETALQAAFRTIILFEHLYIPVKTATNTGMPDDFTYVDIGVSRMEMAEIYNTYYGRNRLVEPLIDRADGYNESVAELNRRILSVYHMNMQKYKKLIELAGYEYNPLWNVDGTEEYTYLENQGTNDTTVTYKTNQRTDTNGGALTKTGSIDNTYGNENGGDINTTSVTPFDSNQWQDTEKNVAKGNTTQTFNSVTDTDSRSITYGAHDDETKTEVTHHNAKNGNAEYSGGTDAFGNVVVGGDTYHTEKRVRSGNIGVTKTQELIESERLNLRFSIMGEFFKDINEQVLVGIYF